MKNVRMMTLVMVMMAVSSAWCRAGVLSGRITDCDANAIPGVTVTVEIPALARTFLDTTSRTGRYRFLDLPPGHYILKAELMGMVTVCRQVDVAEHRSVRLDFVMTMQVFHGTICCMAPDCAEQVPGSSDLFAEFSESGGISGGGNVRVHGDSVDNVYLFDGVDTADPLPEYGVASAGKIIAVTRCDVNGFHDVLSRPLSTFSIDVDTASYSRIRRVIRDGNLPEPASVRIEEMINYFTYDYPYPEGDDVFSVLTELSDCPWNRDHLLLRIGIQGKPISGDDLPPGNLVFLLDVSGSMQDSDKLPLMKSAMKRLVDRLRPSDRVSIVVYSGSAGVKLPATSGDRKGEILAAIESLKAEGATAGGEGIVLAYRVAEEQFMPDGNNRVILVTDGDFNVGISSDDALVRLIEKKRESGVFLSVLGVGECCYKDVKMEKLADRGNGNYAYLDSVAEAEKVLVDELSGTLATIAGDVKLQLEFNPDIVGEYRLIGYENRVLPAEDFNDDRKDAGELGAGHCVTALYEITPVESLDNPPMIDPLRYQRNELSDAALRNNELMVLKIRMKSPGDSVSRLQEIVADYTVTEPEDTSDDFRFAAAVAEFGMILRNSPYRAESSIENVLSLAEGSQGVDFYEYRAEFIEMVRKAAAMMTSGESAPSVQD